MDFLDITPEEIFQNEETALQENRDLDTSFRDENEICMSPLNTSCNWNVLGAFNFFPNETDIFEDRCLSPIPEENVKPKIQCTIDLNNCLRTPLLKGYTSRTSFLQERTPFSIKQYKHKPLLCIDKDKENLNTHCQSVISKPVPEKTITVKDVTYIVWDEIGKGGSSVIYHCFEPQCRNQRAIKCVSLKNDSAANSYTNEVNFLQTVLSCDHVIKMYDCEILQNKQTLLIVMELGNGDLHSVLKQLAVSTKQLPLYKLMYYWLEILNAVNQIHKKGIVHADIKPANFIFVKGDLKLIDFGIARYMEEGKNFVIKDVPEGSVSYISPEALRNLAGPNETPKYKISLKSDVWSLGCILYQMVYRRTPFQHVGQLSAKLAGIVDPNHLICYPTTDKVPERVINTIKECLQYEPQSRPSVQELIDMYMF